MKNGSTHLAHIIRCFQSYGFFAYQCTDLFQIQIDFIAIHNNISVLGKVLEIKESEFDLKKSIRKEDLTTLFSITDKAESGVVVYSIANECYYRLPTEILQKAKEMDIRLITLTSMTLYSKALEQRRKKVNERI